MNTIEGPEIQPDDFAFVYLDVDNPTVAWLAYRGVLNSPDIKTANPGNLSWFLVDVLRRGLASTIRREGLLEGFRDKHFPNAVPRLRCVYAYPTLEAAQKGDYGRGKFRKENLVAIGPGTIDPMIETYDSNWITDFDSLTIDAAKKYWAGEKTKDPHPELLLSGRFWIFGTSVRKRAYETIKAVWPNALALLELSRLAVDFDSDFGTISPWLVQEDRRIVVKHIIRYDEQEGLEILKEAIERSKIDTRYQVNWADLEPLRAPSENKEADERFRVPDTSVYDHEFRSDKLDELNHFVQFVFNQH